MDLLSCKHCWLSNTRSSPQWGFWNLTYRSYGCITAIWFLQCRFKDRFVIFFLASALALPSVSCRVFTDPSSRPKHSFLD